MECFSDTDEPSVESRVAVNVMAVGGIDRMTSYIRIPSIGLSNGDVEPVILSRSIFALAVNRDGPRVQSKSFKMCNV